MSDGNQALPPNVITPTMIRREIEAKLRSYHPLGLLTARVTVGKRLDGSGFDVEVVPEIQPVIVRQVGGE